jgi:N-acyl-L-homoserine lactone synthetase
MLWSKANAGIFRMSMIHVVTPENEHFYRDEMDQAYRLRHKVFVEEMGWKNMAKPDGREMDQFDTKHAVNMLYIEGGNVLGYQRLLPSTRPYLLSEVMPELCEVERPVGAHIWEVSRHCVGAGPSLRRAICQSGCQRTWIGLGGMGSRMRNFEVYH